MSTVQGLPAHILLVHFIVVLVPLTAALTAVSAVWSACRRRLIWLLVALAVVVAALTPVTTEAGEWLEHRLQPTDALRAHASLGDTMPYFAAALLLAVTLLSVVHLLEHRGRTLPSAFRIGTAIVIVIVCVAATAQVYRVGDSGSRSAWSGEMASTKEG